MLRKVQQAQRLAALSLWTGLHPSSATSPHCRSAPCRRRAPWGPGNGSGSSLRRGPPTTDQSSAGADVQIHLPYARFQFVIFDADTLDHHLRRGPGDPRGSRQEGEPCQQGLGTASTAASASRSAPPAWISARNCRPMHRLCRLCLDACDQVMDKSGIPRGLIRYSTENAVVGSSRARNPPPNLPAPNF